MTALHAFTVFHANLDFSALPEADVPLVLERCYWPLLHGAAEDRLRLGIELPARTLERIAREDPEWVKTLRELAERGLVEVVGSGLAQLAAPLVPVDVNRANLRLGLEVYASLLGIAPTTWFVHEQTFASGLGPLYEEIGAQALVMEWNNPASHREELRLLRHRPVRLATGSAGGLPLLWNDSVLFQKLQRVAHGVLPLEEYLAYVHGACAPGEGRVACAYGGDLEIFDYRPGHAPPPGAERGEEMARVRAALRALARSERCALVLPRDAHAGLPPGPLVELASAADPVPCKKQPRYNPTRWAVSGRDGFGQNTRCFRLRRGLGAARALEGPLGPASRPAWSRALVELWRSDLRTRATEEKLEEFHVVAGRVDAFVRERLDALIPLRSPDRDVLLLNPWDEAWDGEPVEVPLRLPPGRLAGGRVLAEPAAALPEGAAQLEVLERHRDGSIRTARLVLAPRLGPGEWLDLRLVPRAPTPASDASPDPARIETAAVRAHLLPHRGGALAALSFPALSPDALVGTIPHGTFDDVALTPDFYSAHAVAVTEPGEKITDLAPIARVRALAEGPLRTAIALEVPTPLGTWRKLYRAYHDRPRLDLVHELHLREVRLRSLRVATVTWLPTAFERERLAYATVNGGDRVERFALPFGVRIEQPRAPAPSVSATSCLGATEGWVSAGDARVGVAVLGDRSQGALAPLLEFQDAEGRFLLRLHQSAAETDETRATFLRGVQSFRVALVGHGDDLGGVRRAARALQRGLVYRTEHGVGLAPGL
jgi:hypothetical protein